MIIPQLKFFLNSALKNRIFEIKNYFWYLSLENTHFRVPWKGQASEKARKMCRNTVRWGEEGKSHTEKGEPCMELITFLWCLHWSYKNSHAVAKKLSWNSSSRHCCKFLFEKSKLLDFVYTLNASLHPNVKAELQGETRTHNWIWFLSFFLLEIFSNLSSLPGERCCCSATGWHATQGQQQGYYNVLAGWPLTTCRYSLNPWTCIFLETVTIVPSSQNYYSILYMRKLTFEK